MSKALGLLSGGLDSSLAALALKNQGVEVTCIAFVTPFFGAGRAEKAARLIGIPLLVREISDIHLEMVKNPRYGYGKNLNPCIDCHALMFRLAGKIMDAESFDFLFSGEVLGQRPMSQNLSALKAVANYSGYGERILRPMSARLLPPTPMEEKGLVDRERLLDIQGRSRKRQALLAEEWGLTEYPSSGGGCLLTEPSFSGRLRDLLQNQPDCTPREVQMLKAGRYFRLSPQASLFLGRNQEDNETLASLAGLADLRLKTADFNGPLGIISGEPSSSDLCLAASLVAAYGKGREETEVSVLVQRGATEERLTIAPADRETMRKLQVH